MPELPEVETTLRGLQPQLLGETIEQLVVRQAQLRWPIPVTLADHIAQQTIQALSRRGKYLLIHLASGTILCHLGMSGSFRITSPQSPLRRHDHVDFILSHHKILRYHDPRRFGAILWIEQTPDEHPLLRKLGIEPLANEFCGEYLYQASRLRKTAIKAFLMNHQIVVGIGNIYATEALFLAKINPKVPANALTSNQYEILTMCIKQVLTEAITAGGTTLRDFVNSDGNAGYFAQKLHVYGRATQPCFDCKTPIQSVVISQRSSAFCPQCQPPLVLSKGAIKTFDNRRG